MLDPSEQEDEKSLISERLGEVFCVGIESELEERVITSTSSA